MALSQIKVLLAATVVAILLSQSPPGSAAPPVAVPPRSTSPTAPRRLFPTTNTQGWKPGSVVAVNHVPPAPAAEFVLPKPAGNEVDDPEIQPATSQNDPPSATKTPEAPTSAEPDTPPPKSTIGNLLNQPEAPTATSPPPSSADAPVSSVSSLLGQLSKSQERVSQSASPATTGVDVTSQSASSAVDTTQLVRQSNSAASISGVRRSAVSIQPVIRGYQQQQIYAQYQGGNFVPARFDFDSILSNIDPGVIDNLIIIPGPYGVKYGPGLSFIDIVPTQTPRYDSPEFHSRTNVLAQSNGAQIYGREMFYGGGQDYGFRFSFGQKVGSDYLSGNETSIPASYNVRDVDLAVGFDLSEAVKIEIEYLTQDMTNTEFAGLVFDADFRKTDALFARVTVDEPGSIHWLFETWFNRTSFQGDNLNPSKQYFYRNNPFFNGSNPPNPYPHVSFVGFTDARTTNTGFRLAPTWGEPGEVQVTAGIDFRYVAQQLNEFDLFENKDLQNSPTGYDNYPIPPSTSYDPGIYFELKAPIDEQFTVTTGARIDMITSDANATYRTTAPDGTIPQIIDANHVVQASFEDMIGGPFYQRNILLAGFLAADYKLTDELLVRAGFGHGERAASATERYAYLPFLTIVQNPSNFPSGDPRLKPEKANQFDLALVGNFEDARFQVSGFASFIVDYITMDILPSNAGPPGVRYTNTDATLAGGEASGEYDVTQNWSPFFNLSYVDGRDQVRDEPLPSIFPFQARLGLRWHDPERKKYGVELYARVVNRQTRVSTHLFEPTTPGFTTCDLRAYWQFSEHLRLNGGIENITNKNYLEHLSVHNPAVYEPGTNFYLAMQVDY